MFENFMGMLKKRRRLDEDASGAGGAGAGLDNRSNSSGSTAAASMFASGLPTHSNMNMFWDSLFGSNNEASNTAATANQTPQTAHNLSDNNTSMVIHNSNNLSMCIDRFVTVLDQLDARVEKFRKDALGLQEKRDFLLMSIDLIKSNDLMQNLSESEREEISCYIQRVNSRLSTVELNVRTVRDQSQEDSLSQINVLIDMMITMGDPVLSRQRCQMYLNACCSARESGNLPSCSESGIDMDAGPVDKKFESVLLGCTLDDQKNIKKRLQALMGYLNKQIIHH
ncbi:BAG family molecular chaperone regulator 2 isoform X2 [Lucilia sericata]|uniref:BAG family molecular chaperone regulator 2 isoform X2 n=1 Tax=Lucilia sericata TaxID=13632 RepID=UPI0018A8815C|nr:BAG family molecular chaperone regulator 2 isoform X2 [Lucilia sericata]